MFRDVSRCSIIYHRVPQCVNVFQTFYSTEFQGVLSSSLKFHGVPATKFVPMFRAFQNFKVYECFKVWKVEGKGGFCK
jgi:hypothetical protein